jgi:mRNA deadenylase 3'-5' endonuclease subunit Ccr4
VFPLIKNHPLGYRSVLNDDLVEYFSRKNKENDFDKNIWTTWKARWKKDGSEFLVKQCIDYVFYSPSLDNEAKSCSQWVIQAESTLEPFEDRAVERDLFPSSSYPSDHISLFAVLNIVKRNS